MVQVHDENCLNSNQTDASDNTIDLDYVCVFSKARRARRIVEQMTIQDRELESVERLHE